MERDGMEPAALPLAHVSRAPSTPPADGERTPAVLVCHGRGTDEFDLLPLTQAFPEVHVLSLRAPFTGAQGGNVWYELDLSGGDLHRNQPGEGFRESLDRLHEFADAVEAVYPVRLAGLVGFSQGGILALAALVERPAVYGRVAALHAYLPATHDPRERPDFDPAGTAAFLAAGTGDRVIPADRTAAAAEALEGAGVAVSFDRYPGGHGISRGERDAVAEWLTARV